MAKAHLTQAERFRIANAEFKEAQERGLTIPQLREAKRRERIAGHRAFMRRMRGQQSERLGTDQPWMMRD